VNLIAGAISSLPLHLYKRDREGNRERLFDDPLWWVLNEEFTPRWSAAVGWEYLVASRLLLGDGFARIHPPRRRGPKGLEPIHPNRVTVLPSIDGSRLIYSIEPDPTIVPPRGQAAPQRMVLDQDDMIHISGSGFDGIRTPSPLRNMLRMSGSVALSAQEFSARFFANGARPDYALQTDNSP
jgi:HK97 family phage portal protein